MPPDMAPHPGTTMSTRVVGPYALWVVVPVAERAVPGRRRTTQDPRFGLAVRRHWTSQTLVVMNARDAGNALTRPIRPGQRQDGSPEPR